MTVSLTSFIASLVAGGLIVLIVGIVLVIIGRTDQIIRN